MQGESEHVGGRLLQPRHREIQNEYVYKTTMAFHSKDNNRQIFIAGHFSDASNDFINATQLRPDNVEFNKALTETLARIKELS